jgi:pimeloyl-ACP methyl ester carboxylesterase
VYENRLAFALREDDGGLVWRSDPAALEQIMSGRMPADDRWDALARITAPTLVVRGTRSNVLAEDVARRMVQTLSDGRLMELEAGHNVPLDRPRELADAVVALAR